MSFENGDKVQILSNGRAYKGVHDGKIGEVMFNGDKRSKFNITVLIEKESNPNSRYGVWYIDAKYLKLVEKQDVGILEINQELQKIEEIMTEDKPYGQIIKDVVNNNKKENKNMRTIGILDLWAVKINDRIRNDYNKELDKIFEADSKISEVKEHVNIIQSIADETGRGKIKELSDKFVRQFSTDKTDGAISRLDDEFNGYKFEHEKVYHEIKTMLSACDTYEQEMDVLKAYKIVDENGVLVKD